MPGTVWTKVDRVDYGNGWTREDLENGGYRLTSTGTEESDATIHRDEGKPDVPVVNAPAGTTITVTGGGTADVHTP